MVFSSLLFIYAFLPVSIGAYYIAPRKLRNVMLLIISLIFCALLGLKYLAVLSVYTLISFLSGLLLQCSGKVRPLAAAVLAVGLAINISVLLIFKTDIIPFSDLTSGMTAVGISFLILSSAGYLIDIFRGKITAEKNILKFLLYMMFFAKLPMGPVISYRSFSRMIKARRDGLSEVGAGLSIFVTGLAKKVIFADNLYLLCNAIKAMDVYEISAISAWLGLIAYILCLYFTLSGVSDMGMGIARCFGIRLPRSFRYPMFSAGISDFCSRWHKPVVSWFRSYITEPVSGKISNEYVKCAVFITVWGLCGLWYECSINKLIWGLLIGAFAVIELKTLKQKSGKATAIVSTFFVTSLCWIFFFGENPIYAFKYLLAMLGGNNILADSVSLYLLRSYAVLIIAGIICSVNLFGRLIRRSRKKLLKTVSDILSPVFIMALLVICTALISYTGISETIILTL